MSMFHIKTNMSGRHDLRRGIASVRRGCVGSDITLIAKAISRHTIDLVEEIYLLELILAELRQKLLLFMLNDSFLI
jgi:hypothetical protein